MPNFLNFIYTSMMQTSTLIVYLCIVVIFPVLLFLITPTWKRDVRETIEVTLALYFLAFYTGVFMYAGKYIDQLNGTWILARAAGVMAALWLGSRMFELLVLNDENRRTPSKKEAVLSSGETAKIVLKGKLLEIYNSNATELLFSFKAEEDGRFEFFAKHEQEGECPVLHRYYKKKDWHNRYYCKVDVSNQSMECFDKWKLPSKYTRTQ